VSAAKEDLKEVEQEGAKKEEAVKAEVKEDVKAATDDVKKKKAAIEGC
jgi:hypothetical protein